MLSEKKSSVLSSQIFAARSPSQNKGLNIGLESANETKRMFASERREIPNFRETARVMEHSLVFGGLKSPKLASFHSAKPELDISRPEMKFKKTMALEPDKHMSFRAIEPLEQQKSQLDLSQLDLSQPDLFKTFWPTNINIKKDLSIIKETVADDIDLGELKIPLFDTMNLRHTLDVELEFNSLTPSFDPEVSNHVDFMTIKGESGQNSHR